MFLRNQASRAVFPLILVHSHGLSFFFAHLIPTHEIRDKKLRKTNTTLLTDSPYPDYNILRLVSTLIKESIFCILSAGDSRRVLKVLRILDI